MNRQAWIVWLGGGILGKVAGDMILEDRLGRAAVITVLGWWLSRRPHPRVPENV